MSRRGSKASPNLAGSASARVVRDQVHGKLDVTFVDQGDRQVKNIARPIRASSASRCPKTRRKNRRGTTHAHRGFGPDQQPIGVCKVSLSIASPRNIGLSSFIHGGSCSRPCERAFLVHWREVQIWGTGLEPNLAGERWSRQDPIGRARGTGPSSPQPTMIGDPVFFEKDNVVLSRSANAIIERQAEYSERSSDNNGYSRRILFRGRRCARGSLRARATPRQ